MAGKLEVVIGFLIYILFYGTPVGVPWHFAVICIRVISSEIKISMRHCNVLENHITMLSTFIVFKKYIEMS